MPSSDPPSEPGPNRKLAKLARVWKRVSVQGGRLASQLATWISEKAAPRLLQFGKWSGQTGLALANRLAHWLNRKGVPGAARFVKWSGTKGVACGKAASARGAQLLLWTSGKINHLARRVGRKKREKTTAPPVVAQSAQLSEREPLRAIAPTEEVEEIAPVKEQAHALKTEQEALHVELPAEEPHPDVQPELAGIYDQTVPEIEPASEADAAPEFAESEDPEAVYAAAEPVAPVEAPPLPNPPPPARPSRLASLLDHPLVRRWALPAALLFLAGLIVLTLLGKMRGEVWTYYTDDQGTRAAVDEEKTRFVLWEDPQPLTFQEERDPKKPATDPVNRPAGRLEAAFSPNGAMMVIVRWEKAESNADMYLSQWDGRLWSRPQPLASLNSESNERSPAFSPDGRYLYFSSDRSGGEGGYDLYVARWDGEKWDGGESLGSQVNSPDDELGPALSADDGRLYFSSNREGASGEDIFMATRSPGERGDQAEKLPPVPRFESAEPVKYLNSRARDVEAVLTSRGNHVFLASDRDRTKRQGYGVYFSRVVDGVSLPPERVDLYIEKGDVTDPAVRMEGFDLLFSADHEANPDEEGPGFRLYRSTTREVIGYTDLTRWEQFKDLLGNIKWWILLALAALLGLIYLLETWQDITSLFHKCLAGSVAAHLLLLLVFMAMLIAQELEKQIIAPPTEIMVSVDALSEEELALESLPEESEITQPDLSLPAEKAQAAFDVPDFQPQDNAQAVPVDAQFQQEAMEVEVRPANADAAEEHLTQPAEASNLLSELSATTLPEPDQPVLDEREFAEAPEPANPADDQFRPQETPPATERTQSEAVADTAVETPAEVAEVKPAESLADLPAPTPLTEVQPNESDQAPADQPDTPQPLESQLLADLPDAAPADAERPQLEEGNPNPNNAPANPADDLFNPANSVPTETASQAQGQALGDSAAESQADAAEVAAGGFEANPIAQGPAASVGEAQSESQLDEPNANPGPLADLPESALLDPGVPRLDEGDPNPNEAPANPANDLFNPNGAVAETATAQLEGTAVSDAAVPNQADAAEVASGEVAPTPLAPGPSPAVGEAQADESVPKDAVAAGLPNDLPASDLLDPGAPRLEEGEDQPANAPADPGKDLFKPNSGNAQLIASQLGSGAASDSAENNQAEATEVAQGELASEPANPGAAAAVGEAKSEAEGPAVGALANNLPAPSLLDPGAPALEEGPQGGAPVDSSADQFKPSGPQTASNQAQGSTSSDNPASNSVEAEAIAGGALVAQISNLTGPQTGLEAGASESPAPTGTLGAVSLDPALTASLLPGELEAPEGGAITDFLKKQRGRPSLETIKQLGGSDGTEKAIRASIQWLAENQEESGLWNARKHGAKGEYDTGVTGLALLCFYGWGARHDEEGEYRENVGRALAWLLTQQKKDGDLSGEGLMYCHSIASIALCEAYGITRDPKLKGPAQRAIAYTLAAQSKTKGGWRYHPGDDSDTSITGWQYMAIHSARLAGLVVPEKSFELARGWLDRAGGGKHGGLYGYQAPARNSPAMVATGMFCRQLDLVPPTSPMQMESASVIKMNPMESRNLDYYYLYYATLALYQHQGPVWEAWNERLKETVPQLQHKTGSRKGSWDPSRGLAGNGGRVTSTTLATLSLEVYYRILPIYGFRGNEETAPEVKKKGAEENDE